MTRVFVAFVAVLVMSGPAIAEVQTKATNTLVMVEPWALKRW